MELLNLKYNKAYFASMILEYDKKCVNALNIQNNQFIKLDLVRYIESLSDSCFTFTATELTNYRIVVIINFSKNSNEILDYIRKIIAYSNSEYAMPVIASLGSYQEEELSLYKSFNDAEKVLQYAFFLPDREILQSGILEREKSTEIIPNKLAKTFSESLRTGDFDSTRSNIENLVEYMQTRNYSISHCHHVLLNYMNIFSLYIKDINLKSEEKAYVDILQDIKSFNHILDFKEKFMLTLSKLSDIIANKKINHNFDVIERVKNYIFDNISGDLSLEAVAGKVYLNASYLSKIFKEITGTTFIEYVTAKKLGKARELIRNTDMKIEDIAHSVGYNTHHHFTKLFKKAYGITPKEFKQSDMICEPK